MEKIFCYFCLDKLIHFLNNKISLPDDNNSLYLLKLQFSHSPGREQSKISFFQAMNIFPGPP